ncbi:type II toxin-antitoxin system RelE/ParE family toxin [Phytopseudomonas dryadis]|nr:MULTISPECIES: type II toxin-antitoxin system RelE/ParE family toxin [Pseudomonas]
MKRGIRLRPEVEAELEAAIDWYEACAPGLGSDFMRAVEASLASIERNPEYYQVVFDTARRALLRRFPYALIYSIEPDAIVIAACLHTRQNPERWQRQNG